MDFIADYLFRPDAGITSRAIAEQFPGAFVSGQFITLHDPGVMFVAFGDGDLDGLRALVERAIAQMRTPLAAETFANARAAFEYHLLSDLQTPSEMADNFGWYSVEGNLQYAPGINASGSSYFSTAATLTPQFVARVAEKYLAKPAARAVLVPGTQKGQRRASSSS
jgi:predicted Zn-dependent peptidase